jgi:hypothetical protein
MADFAHSIVHDEELVIVGFIRRWRRNLMDNITTKHRVRESRDRSVCPFFDLLKHVETHLGHRAGVQVYGMIELAGGSCCMGLLMLQRQRHGW